MYLYVGETPIKCILIIHYNFDYQNLALSRNFWGGTQRK